MLLSRLGRLSPTLSTRMSSSTAKGRVSLLSPSELSKLISSGKESVRPVDASWFMPNLTPPRDGFKEWRKLRIENSAYWSLDQISSPSDVGVPHNIPTKELFEDACSRLGLTREDHVVFYDSAGVFSSPRAAFTFKHFSHPLVSILDGGLPRWIAEGHPVDRTTPLKPNEHTVYAEGETAPSYQPVFSELLYAVKPRIESYFVADIEDLFTDYKVPEGAEKENVLQWDAVNANIEKGEGQGDVIVDARPEGRFHGSTPEPREGLSSGHMPGAFSVPFSNVLSAPSSTEPSFKTLKSEEELEEVYKKAVGEENWEKIKGGERGLIATCGSGMTAGILWLGLERLGLSDRVKIYDESWTGYAARPESKIVKS